LQRDDTDLLRRAGGGDARACEEILERYGPGLYRLAYLFVGNAADAEDVMQESLMAAVRGAERFGGRSSVKTWLSRIVVRQAARYHRGRRRLRLLGGREDDRAGGGGSRQAEVRMDVRAALDGLGEDQRKVIVLRELEGMSYEEIAAVLGVPVGTVESRLFRARRELRKLLADYLADED
jgi:RNA polymerase sigma-70 factor (ECF subfamily)